jgi:hypothetical protein
LLTHPVLLLLPLVLLLQLPLMLCCCCQLDGDAVVWLALTPDLLDVCQGAVVVDLQQMYGLLPDLHNKAGSHACGYTLLRNQVHDDCWTMFGTPPPTGEYQQLSVNTAQHDIKFGATSAM